MKPLKVNGVPCTPSKISVEPLKYPLSRYLFIVLPGDGSRAPRRCSNSSTGCGAARWPVK